MVGVTKAIDHNQRMTYFTFISTGFDWFALVKNRFGLGPKVGLYFRSAAYIYTYINSMCNMQLKIYYSVSLLDLKLSVWPFLNNTADRVL